MKRSSKIVSDRNQPRAPNEELEKIHHNQSKLNTHYRFFRFNRAIDTILNLQLFIIKLRIPIKQAGYFPEKNRKYNLHAVITYINY